MAKLTGIGFMAVSTVSWLSSLKASTNVEYNPESDPRVTPEWLEAELSDLQSDGDENTTIEDLTAEYPPGSYLHNGENAIECSWSAGTGGKGNAKIELRASQLASVAAAFADFDPDAEIREVSPAEAIRATIRTETEGEDATKVVAFKVSLAKNAREIRVPLGEFADVRAYFSGLASKVPDVVTQYRTMVAEAEAAERAEAAKAAAKAAGKK